ncbi:MAG: phosphodiester glycosidase family protein [Clostridiaceae bacterium]|nr:phosphodiester glycosidase family protein [Clostridiaceae bacterium]
MKNLKTRILWKSVVFFLVYMVIFTGVTSVIMTLYGPFDNVKRTFVGSAMATMNHKYLATMFLSQGQIDKILGKDLTTSSDETNVDENINAVKISKLGDNTIERRDINTTRFDGYILEIYNPLRIKVGYTQKLGVRGQTTSTIVKAFGGIAGVNGGGFTDKSTTGKSFVGTGALPEGIVVSEGNTIFKNVREDEKFEAIAFNKNGTLIVGKHTLNNLLSQGVQEAISFNKTLIMNGIGQVKGDGSDGMSPRTAIGQKQNGHILLVVIDGRSGGKLGATFREVQDLLLQEGAWNAANLDGGSSTTMYYDGGLINNPSDSAGERTIATALYVTP